MEAASKLARSAHSKKAAKAILVRTQKSDDLFSDGMLPRLIELVDSTALRVSERVAELLAEIATEKAANTAFQGTHRQAARP